MISKSKRSLWGWSATAALIVAGMLITFGGERQREAQKPDGSSLGQQTASRERGEAPPAAVEEQTYTVAQGDVVRTLIISGELQAEQSVEISVPRIRSSFASTVTYLAAEGELVQRGDLVVEFDSSALQSQKSEAERKLDEARLNIEKQKAELEVQRCDLLNAVAQAEGSYKVAALYGKITQDLLPANTYQQYQVNLEKAKLSLDKAQEQLANFEASYAAQMSLVEISREQAEVDLKKIDNDLAMLSVRAPQEGIVVYGDNWASNRKVQQGDSLFPGMPVVTLPDLETLQVVGYVYDTELSFLSKGMRCSIGLDAVAGDHIEGAIVSLTSVASRKGFATQQKVFRAVVLPDKIDLSRMKPGMTAHIEVPVKLAAGVTTVPRDFIGLDSQRRYYVRRRMSAETTSPQVVELGTFGDREVEVVSGVSIGDILLPLQEAAEVGR